MDNEFSFYDSVSRSIRTTLGIIKIKFKYLDDLSFSGGLNALHIDINSFIGKLVKMLKNVEIDEDNNFDFVISSMIINTAAHYRLYYSRKNQDVKIFFYFSKTEYPFIDSAMKYAKTVLNYVDGVYLITGKDDNVHRMNYIASKYNNNLIISTNYYHLQLLNKNNVIIKPNKDNTKFITKDNVYSIIAKDDEMYKDISYKLINVVVSFLTHNGKPLIKKFGIISIMGMLVNGLRFNYISNNAYSSMVDFFSDISHLGLYEKLYNQDVVDNFARISITANTLSKSDTVKIEDQIIDKFAKDELSELNVKYYTGENSLMLYELMMKPNGNKRIIW